MLREAALSLALSLLAAWLALVLLVISARPATPRLREAMRLLPDMLRLFRGLAVDREVPLSVRARLWLLLLYLASPVDIVPDFIPVIGYADDVILALLVLRSVVRRAGEDAIRRHWPGTDDGLAALQRAAGLATRGD